MKYFERELLSEINKYFKLKEIIAIVGPRQSGKTTLLKIIYQKIPYYKKKIFLDFENLKHLEIFNKDIENFKKLFVDPYDFLFIDEFQYGEDGGKKLKYLFDNSKTKIIISGSSSLEIKNLGKYLVGRIFLFKLFPLNFQEFLKAKDNKFYQLIDVLFRKIENLFKNKEIKKITDSIKSQSLRDKLKEYFFEYLIFGGYPRVIKAKSIEEKKLVLESIVENYLLKEIRTLLKLATENELLNLGKFLSFQIGNLISYNELSTSTNLNFQNVKKHLKILEETFIIKKIIPYFKNKRLELVKNPKVYFIDLGFRNKLINNFSAIESRTDVGSLVENFVFNSLMIKKNVNQINFWRTKSQAEIDFVIEAEGELIPIEVKFSPVNKKVIGKSLFSFIKKYHPKKAIITTSDDFGIRNVEKTVVYFIPVYYV